MPATVIIQITYTLHYIPKAMLSQKQPQKIIFNRQLDTKLQLLNTSRRNFLTCHIEMQKKMQ